MFSVLNSIGNYFTVNHQSCLVYWIQLVIIKIPYDKDYSAENSGRKFSRKVSAPEVISAKIKSEISDSSINDLCFLQSYFQKDNLLIALSN